MWRADEAGAALSALLTSSSFIDLMSALSLYASNAGTVSSEVEETKRIFLPLFATTCILEVDTGVSGSSASTSSF